MCRIVFVFSVLLLLYYPYIKCYALNPYQSCGQPTQVVYSFSGTGYSQDITNDLQLGRLSNDEKNIITNPSIYTTVMIVDTLCNSVDNVNLTVSKLMSIRSTGLFTDKSYQIVSITDGNSYSILSGDDDRKEVLEFCQRVSLDGAYDPSFSLLPSLHCVIDYISRVSRSEQQQQQQQQQQQLIFVSSNGISHKIYSDGENNYDLVHHLDRLRTFWIIEDASQENMNIIQGSSGSVPFVDFYVLPRKSESSITNDLIKSYITTILLDISYFRGDILKEIIGPILCDETCRLRDNSDEPDVMGLVDWNLQCKNIPSVNTIHSYQRLSSFIVTEEECKSPDLEDKLTRTHTILDSFHSARNSEKEGMQENDKESEDDNGDDNDDSSFFDEEMITIELKRYNLVSVRTYHSLPSNDSSGKGSTTTSSKTNLGTDRTVNEFEICVADDNSDVNPVTTIGFSDNMDGDHFQTSFTSDNLASSSTKWRLFGDSICASFSFGALQYYSSLSSIDNSEFWILVSTLYYDSKILVQFTGDDKDPIQLFINPISQPILDLYVTRPKVSLVTYSEKVYVKIEAFISIEQDEQRTGFGGYELESVKELFWENNGGIPFHLSDYIDNTNDNNNNVKQHYSDTDERMNSVNIKWDYALDYVDIIPIQRECLDSRDLYFVSFMLETSDTIGVMKFEESLRLRMDIINNINAQWIQQQHLYFDIDLFLLKQSDLHVDRWVGYNLELFKDKSLTQRISSIGDIKNDVTSKTVTIYGRSKINNPLYQLRLEHLLLCSSNKGTMKPFDPFYAHSTGCDTKDDWGIDSIVTRKHAYGYGATLKESKGFFSLLDQQLDSFTFKLIVPSDKDVILRVDWEVIPIIGAGFTKNDDERRLFSDSVDNPSFLIDHHFSGSEYSLLESQVHKVLRDQKLFLQTFPFSYERVVYSPHFSSQLQVDSVPFSLKKPTTTVSANNKKTNPDIKDSQALSLSSDGTKSNQNDNIRQIAVIDNITTSPVSVVNTGDQLLQDHTWNTIQNLQLFVQPNEAISLDDRQNYTISLKERNWDDDGSISLGDDDDDGNNDDDDDNGDDDDKYTLTFTRKSGSSNSRDKHLFLMLLILTVIILFVACIATASCFYYCWWIDDNTQIIRAPVTGTSKESQVIDKRGRRARRRISESKTNGKITKPGTTSQSTSDTRKLNV